MTLPPHDDDPYNSNWYYEQAAIAERQNQEHLQREEQREQRREAVGKAARERFIANWNKSFADEADDQDEATSADELDSPPEPEGTSDNVVSKKPTSISFDLADGTRIRFPTERALAEWTAIQQRIRKSTSTSSTEESTMSLDLSAVVKAHGIGALCRHFIKSASSFGVDEHELVKLATEDAARRYPADTPAIAFSKIYAESTELREAIEIAKGAAFENAVTAEIEKDAREACEELTKIGKARWPSLTPAQRFARAFECSPELAKRAHRRPGPSTSFAHPVAKAPLVPTANLTPAVSDNLDVDNPEAALAALRRIGASMWPTKSEAEQLINAVTDLNNSALVSVWTGSSRGVRQGSTPPRE